MEALAIERGYQLTINPIMGCLPPARFRVFHFMAKIKNENYFQVSGWMLNELGLKGNELIVYAIIHGFTQDGNNWFTGSLSYISEFAGCSKRTVQNVLSDLEQKGLLHKENKTINSVTYCRYKTINGIAKIAMVEQKLPQGIAGIATGGMAEIATNNKPLNNKSNKKVFIPPSVEEVIDFFREKNQSSDFAKKVYDYYSLADWTDSKGNKVKNWKQKMYAVWILKAEQEKEKNSAQKEKEIKVARPKDVDYSQIA